LFSSYKCYANEIEKTTRGAFNAATRMIPEGAMLAGWNDNKLIKYLCDYSTEGDFLHTEYPVKSNISAILSGQGKYSCVFSINNLDAIPMVNNILNSFCYVETVTIVKPGKRQVNEIEKNIKMNKAILESIRPADYESRPTRVRVDTIEKDISSLIEDIRTGLFFINVSFCIKSGISMNDLKETYGVFEDVMYQKGIVLYSHSNSARAAYISLFPGNGIYGEHWNTVYKRFGIMLISKVMAL
jgi:hypothetical protein